jgi:hypothetical protein
VSGDDVSELWDAINKLREGQGEVLTELRALISMLKERCEARASILVDHASRLKTLELALQAVKLEQVRQGVLIGLGGGLVGSLVTLGGMLIVKKLGG